MDADELKNKSRMDVVKIYRGRDGWRWKRVARNGRIVGASTESYVRLVHCQLNAARVNGTIAKLLPLDQ